MREKPNLLRWGIVGSVLTALCCFTPILVILFSAIGLAGIVGYLDLVLFPALGIFLLITVYAFYKSQRGQTQK